jgi:hypothetical protein
MNNRILYLENTVLHLMDYINSSNTKNFNSQIYTTNETNSLRYQSEALEEHHRVRGNTNNSWSDILQELKVNRITKIE